METQAEYTVSPNAEETDIAMHPYIVVQHLVSQGYTDFTELRELLSFSYYDTYYTDLLERIGRKMTELETHWGESIPPITALVFKADGTATESACQALTGNSTTQPTAKQIAKLAASVAAYHRWDDVLNAFRSNSESQSLPRLPYEPEPDEIELTAFNIRRKRLELGMPKSALVRELGLADATELDAWESGERPVPEAYQEPLRIILALF